MMKGGRILHKGTFVELLAAGVDFRAELEAGVGGAGMSPATSLTLPGESQGAQQLQSPARSPM